MVGGRSRGAPPQYRRPGEPAIANHQTHRKVDNELSRRLEASDAGNRRPEHRDVTPVLGMAPCVKGGWLEPLRGVQVTPSGLTSPAQRTTGLSASQLDMEWQPHLKESSEPCRSAD